VKDRVLARLDTAPFQLAVDHVILDPTEGLVARGVYLYRGGDFSEPLARAESVTLDTSWRRTLRGDPGVHVVRLQGGSLRLPGWQADAAAERVALSGLDGTVLIEPASFRVPELSARLWGLQVAASGTVVRPPAASGGQPLAGAGGLPGRAAAGARPRAGSDHGADLHPLPRAGPAPTLRSPSIPRGATPGGCARAWRRDAPGCGRRSSTACARRRICRGRCSRSRKPPSARADGAATSPAP
jgi:hypothetical protein